MGFPHLSGKAVAFTVMVGFGLMPGARMLVYDVGGYHPPFEEVRRCVVPGRVRRAYS
jgi:hypothetical protein